MIDCNCQIKFFLAKRLTFNVNGRRLAYLAEPIEVNFVALILHNM